MNDLGEAGMTASAGAALGKERQKKWMKRTEAASMIVTNEP